MNIRYPIYEGVYRILTFLCPLFDDETSESSQEHLVPGNHRLPDTLHECLYYSCRYRLFYSGLLCDPGNNICFCQTVLL